MDRPALERKHADLGLRFTPGGLGSFPVQAYGWLGEDRFYFRFRHDCAQLRVGPVDAALNEAEALRSVQQEVAFRERDQIKLALLGPDADEMERRWAEVLSSRRIGKRPQHAGTPDFYPNRVTRHAFRSNVTGEEYAGTLERGEFVALFEEMMLDLQPVPEEQQINEHTIEWLRKGGLWPLGTL
ncbi:hypothetical protein [Agromyces humi]|uniref:hypothetical protein n=1 Tax=Agromyces humi TaxID=1766800 RepID=UPI00135BF6CA|nr:hypothetical protein [Agromyces humi]